MLQPLIGNLLFIQFLPWIIGGIIAIAIAGGFAIGEVVKTEGKTLGVLGMKGAGKTRFLSNLGLFEFKEGTGGTTIEDYALHELKIGDRKITIQGGQDVGGNVDIKGYYNDWVGNKDITVFIFDGVGYLVDPEYRSNVRARLHFIYEIAKKKGEAESDFKNIVVIASHQDLFKDHYPTTAIEEMGKMILADIKDREYSNLLKTNYFQGDMQNKEQVMGIAKQIF